MFPPETFARKLVPVPIVNIAKFLSGITSVDCEWERGQLNEAHELIEREIRILKIPSFRISSTRFITHYHASTQFGYSTLMVRLFSPGIRRKYNIFSDQYKANRVEIRRGYFDAAN